MSASNSLLVPQRRHTPDALGLSTAHIWPHRPPATHTAAVGGSLAAIEFSSKGRNHRRGGGRRQTISTFSRASRRRLLQTLNSINKKQVKIPLFITLTYPGEFPTDPRTWKRDLQAWRRRMHRKFGPCPMVWRLEFQKRGAPHFHLLAFIDATAAELYEFVSRSWYEACGKICPEHLRAGTNVQPVKSWRGVMAYASKYMGKLETAIPGEVAPGRFWGVWSKELLPISVEIIPLDHHQALRLRRIYRKFSGTRYRTQRILFGTTTFVRHETSNRLLAWLGIIGSYPGDEENEHRGLPTQRRR